MKLRAIHTYQYIKFQGRNENFLSIEVDKFKKENLQLTLLPEGVVEVRSNVDCVLVFPTNIAYAKPFDFNSKYESGLLADVDPGAPVKG